MQGGLPRLHHLLPYESYDPDSQLFFNTGSTGFVLQAEPLPGASLHDQSQIAVFFKQQDCLPEGCALQFLLIASPKLQPFMDYWRGHRIPGIYRDLATRRTEFLQDKAREPIGGTVLRDYRVLISYTMPGIIEDSVAKAKIIETRRRLQQTLKLIGLPTQILDAGGLIEQVGNLLNSPTSLKPEPNHWDGKVELNKQIVSSDMTYKVHKDSVQIGDTHCRTYVPKLAPPMWSLPHMDQLLGDLLGQDSSIATPFMLHYGFYVEPNQSRAKVQANARRESLENSLKNKLTKWLAGLEEQYQEAQECVAELQKGERVITASLSLSLFASLEQFPALDSKIKHIWNQAGWELVPSAYDHLPFLMSSLPMTWVRAGKQLQGYGPDLAHLGKAKRTITKEAQNLLPILAEWKGQNSPGMLLYGRRGQAMCWSPFSNALLPEAQNPQTDHNYNVCIAGQSGSGKSVFMQELMLSTLGIGGKVFVLDYGRSFKKTCQLLQGEHIEFDIRQPISLNPFSQIPTGHDAEATALREDLLATLKTIFQVMAAPKYGTSDLQNAYIESALQHVWNHKGNQTSVDDVREYLMQQDKLEAQDLGQMLYSFCSIGNYGKFFAGPAAAKLDSDLVVIETDHLRNHPNLMAVLVQMMILQINQTMARGDRKTPFLIVIDEAWKLLTGKDSAAFISEATRTARKYKGSIVLGTQHLTDYFKPESPAAMEAFNCSAWKCLLYQEADVIRSFKQHPQLQTFVETEFREALLKSVRSKPPYYSEVALYGPQVHGVVGRLSLDPFSRLLYSTNPEEYQAVEHYLSQGLSVADSIEQVLHKRAA